VQGVLIVTSPADTSAHYRIVDDGVKRGALLENPQRPSYLADMLDSTILYGLVASEKNVGGGSVNMGVRLSSSKREHCGQWSVVDTMG